MNISCKTEKNCQGLFWATSCLTENCQCNSTNLELCTIHNKITTDITMLYFVWILIINHTDTLMVFKS